MFIKLLLLIYIVFSIRWIYKILSSYIWIITSRKAKNSSSEDKKHSIFILLPVLYENYRLQEAVDYFRQILEKHPNIKLVIITTVRESCYEDSITIDLAKKLSSNNIIHIHANDPGGNMATQLNCAVDALSAGKYFEDKRIVFGVYNVDSRPEIETFDWLLSHPNLKDDLFCFQQYGDYTKNTDTISKARNKYSLLASSYWQNRWSMGYEIASALRQFSKFRILNNNWRTNYCVGHGVFISESLLKKIDGFCGKTHNEDIFLGLTISNLKVRIFPIPFFDLADSPDDLFYLFKQKTNWFMGTFQVIKYYSIIKENKYFDHNKFRLAFQTLQIFLLSQFWIWGPNVLMLLSTYALLTLNLQLIYLTLLTYVFYLVLPNTLGQYYLKKTKFEKNSLLNLFFISFCGSWLASIIHGIAPFNSIRKYFLQKLLGIEFLKGKTDMRFYEEE